MNKDTGFPKIGIRTKRNVLQFARFPAFVSLRGQAFPKAAGSERGRVLTSDFSL